jgi:hypothetical protein
MNKSTFADISPALRVEIFAEATGKIVKKTSEGRWFLKDKEGWLILANNDEDALLKLMELI